MKSFLHKAKSALHDIKHDAFLLPEHAHQQPIQHNRGDAPRRVVHEPIAADVVKYRYHHGVNLGSVFVQERWLTGSMFPEGAPGSSELAAAEAWVRKLGMDGARERHEKHWREYVTDADLDWLRDVARCTTVRLPIGYFTLGPPYCEKTAFKDVAPVYVNAWQMVKDLVGRCEARGMGVLIDVHGLPGGANGNEHSGTNSDRAEFWTSRKHRQHATKCMCFIAQQARSVAGIAGLQIVNESEWNAAGMYEWYDDVLQELATIDPDLPVYISDGWNLSAAVAWSQRKNAMRGTANPVVVDTHLYWCFGAADQGKSPFDIIAESHTKLHELDGKEGAVAQRGAVQVIVGEYSCVLGDEVWQRHGGASKDDLVRQFGTAQSQRYQARSGGSFFWTYRMDWMPGGEWGFRQMTEHGAITAPPNLLLSADDVSRRTRAAEGQRDGRRGGSWGAHCQYWDSRHPGEYEHWRFETGWNLGWNDACAFFGMRAETDGGSGGGGGGGGGGDKIGMLELWVLKRLRDSGQGGAFAWEFEVGLRQGIRDFYECVGV